MLPKLSLWSVTGLLLYTWFCYLMLNITLQYIPYDTDVAFLRIKQDEIVLPYYRIAFFTHVYLSILVLPAGFIQFSSFVLRKYPRFHRLNGWIYLITILGFSAPSGLIMGFHANGGWSSQLAFCLLALLWMLFTALAGYYAIKKRFILHRQMMYRSFALTLSAITLRAWKYIIVALFHPRPMDVYRIVAWLGWVLNLIIAEWIIRYYLKKRL
ncbi:MAG: DUF2306 domain-containing protein [Saprospiraceae bacterium]|nr:DUF2306 domain-containing protein [Lewinella sp.]